MGRSPCCDKVGLKKGPWTPEEDQKLLAYIQEHGHGSWRALPPKAGLQRCGKSCRLRWTNYLRPDIKRGKFSLQEEQTIIQLHALLGNRWSAIASHLPKRTDNEIKNYWNTHLKKRLTKMGIDPMTHKPKSHALTTGTGQLKDIANLSHMAQWESARLEAEARIVRESKLVSSNSLLIAKTTTTTPVTTVPTPISPRPLCLDILKVWQGAMMGKHRKDAVPTIMGQGFSTASGGSSLVSPTSILNFTDNVITTSSVGLVIHQNSLVGPNYLGNLIMKNNIDVINNNHQDGKGMMDNALELHDNMGDPIIGPNYNVVPSFLEGFADLPEPSIGCGDLNTGPDNDTAYEDNKSSYWNNILNNVVNSPMDALGVI